MEARLDHSRFVRIHRSHIVNAERIKELQPDNGDYTVVLRSGTRLPLSRGYQGQAAGDESLQGPNSVHGSIAPWSMCSVEDCARRTWHSARRTQLGVLICTANAVAALVCSPPAGHMAAAAPPPTEAPHGDVSSRIIWAHVIQQAREQPRRRSRHHQTQHEARGDEHQALAQHQPVDLRRRGAERQADAELLRAERRECTTSRRRTPRSRGRPPGRRRPPAATPAAARPPAHARIRSRMVCTANSGSSASRAPLRPVRHFRWRQVARPSGRPATFAA